MNQHINDCIFEIIPIIILFSFAYYSNEIEEISNTVLGKLLAICIIIYYTNENSLYGILFCLLMIIYYQIKDMNQIKNENIWNMNNIIDDNKLLDDKSNTKNDITFHENQIHKNVSTNYYPIKLNESIAKQIKPFYENDLNTQIMKNTKNTMDYIIQQIDDILQLHSMNSSNNNSTNTNYTSEREIKYINEPFSKNTFHFTNYNYSDLNTNTKDDLKDIFKSQYCKNGILTYKNIGVKSEMTPMIFNEIEFNDENSPCNICSDNCMYKIDPKKISINKEQLTDKKLKTENTLFWNMFQ